VVSPFSRRWHSALLLVLSLLPAISCSPVGAPPLAASIGQDRDIFIVHDDWHAAIVLRKIDIAAALIPETKDFPGAEYLEFSWGDADYFPAPQASIGLALRAAFWSRGSVLHVVGINRPLPDYFSAGQIIQVPISRGALHRLKEFLAMQFDRVQPGARATSIPGLVPNSRFYPSAGEFHIFRTCNTWVAEALQYAGLPVTSGLVITAASLARRVRPLGVVVDADAK
jgi:uncharacterized protein (TIGR02117 family)